MKQTNKIDGSKIPEKKNQKQMINTDLGSAERFKPDLSVGLSATQVLQRKGQGYINATKNKVGKTYRSIFFSNIFTFFNILTFIVAGALIWANAEVTQLLFLAIIVANITIGIVLEIKSKLAVEKLSLISAPNAVAVRDGEKVKIPINEVVLDDILYFDLGKQICADCIVEDGDIEVNESMLTGESVPVKKSKGDVLYSGSFVSSGSCYARVDKVGATNYVETLTSVAKSYRKPKSELQNSIKRIMTVATFFIIPISIFLVYRTYKSGFTMAETIMSASGAVVGMIPAGMFLLTSVALAVSVIRLSTRNILVQDLYCIEMLARVDVLCLDKTGTITDGSMQVKKVIPVKGVEKTEEEIADIVGSMLSATEDNNQTALALAGRFGYSQKLTPTQIMPFSSQRKYSAVTFEDEGTYILGAPEFVLKDMGVKLERAVNEYAAAGYRVIVLAHASGEISDTKVPNGRKPICLMVIEDHIRDAAIHTIEWFKQNDVAVKIISGDNPVTVSEIAKRVGVENAELYISLDGLSSQEVIEAAEKYTVFGRVSPEQKCLIIRALKARRHTVAMTGDGVNDILALKEADCSVAMASGSEAATKISHLVLIDSNFTAMPDVVTEGRRVVNNITKSASLFLMKTFMSIVLSIIFILLGEAYPLQTNNLLLLEMFVIAIPSFMLALQTNTNRIKGNFLSNVCSRTLPGGIALVISIMSIYFYKGITAKLYGAEFLPSESYTAMIVLALALTGVMVLAKNCEPFNFYRVFVVLVSLGLMIPVAVLLKENLGLASFYLKNPNNLTHLLFIGAMVMLSYFLVSILMKILKNLKLLSD